MSKMPTQGEDRQRRGKREWENKKQGGETRMSTDDGSVGLSEGVRMTVPRRKAKAGEKRLRENRKCLRWGPGCQVQAENRTMSASVVGPFGTRLSRAHPLTPRPGKLRDTEQANLRRCNEWTTSTLTHPKP